MAQVAGALEIQLFAGIARLQTDMNQAKSVVTSATQHIESAVASAKNALGALGIALGAAYFVNLIKGSIDAQAHLEDLTKSTALTVTELAGLSMIANESGTNIDSLAKAVDKMSVAIGKDPEKFAALGVTAKDNAGALKQLSDIFNNLTDVQQRNAVAQTVFGKSWAEVAPILAMGSAKIGDLMDKSAALNPNIEENARLAKGLKDQWSELSSAMEASRMQLVAGLYPALIQITGAVAEAYKESGLLMAAWVALGGVGSTVFNFLGVLITGTLVTLQEWNLAMLKFFHAPDADIQALEGSIGRLNKSIVDMTNTPKLAASHPLVDPAVAAEAAARAAAFLKQAKATDDLAKEIAKLMALQQKSETEADAARYRQLVEFYQGVSILRNIDAADAKAIMNLATDDEAVAEARRYKELQLFYQFVQDARNKDAADAVAVSDKAAAQAAIASKKIVGQLDSDFSRAFSGLFDKTVKGWDAMLASMKTSFMKILGNAIYDFFAKPFGLQIIASIAGMAGATGVQAAANTAMAANQTATGGIGLSSLSNFFSMSGVASAALQLGSATGSAMISNFALGMQSASFEAAGAYGAAGSIGYMIPYIGWVLAAYAVWKQFFSDHGPSAVSTADLGRSYGPGAGGAPGAATGTDWTTFGAGGAATMTDSMVKAYTAAMTALGQLTTNASYFYFGSNVLTDSTNPQFRMASTVGTHTYDTGPGETPLTDAAMQLAASRAVLNALQGSDLPAYLQHAFDALTPATATQDQINAAMAFAQQLKTIHDNLTETRAPMQILTDAAAQLGTTLGTSAASFKTDFLAAIDQGITPDKLAQWQQLAAILDSIDATNAKIAAQKGTLQEQLDVLTGARTQQQIDRQHQLATALDPTNAALMQQIFDQQDLAAATEAAAASARDQAAAEAAALAASSAAIQVWLNNIAQMQADQLQYYSTQAQRTAAAQNQINAALDALGYTGDRSVATYDSIMASLDLTTEAGRGLWAILWPLRDAFNAVGQAAADVIAASATTTGGTGTPATGVGQPITNITTGANPAAAAAAAQAAFEASVNPYNNLQMGANPYDIAEAARQAGLAASAQAALTEAEREAAAAAAALTQQLANQKIYQDWLAKLTLDQNLSPLTAQQKLAEAQKQYNDALAGSDASKITATADALLAADKAVEGFAGGYSALFAQIQAQIGALAGPTAAPSPDVAPIVRASDNIASNVINMRDAIARLQERTIETLNDHLGAVEDAINNSGATQARATTNAAATGTTVLR